MPYPAALPLRCVEFHGAVFFPDVMCRCFLNFSLFGKSFFLPIRPPLRGNALSYKGGCPYADPPRQRL